MVDGLSNMHYSEEPCSRFNHFYKGGWTEKSKQITCVVAPGTAALGPGSRHAWSSVNGNKSLRSRGAVSNTRALLDQHQSTRPRT